MIANFCDPSKFFPNSKLDSMSGKISVILCTITLAHTDWIGLVTEYESEVYFTIYFLPILVASKQELSCLNNMAFGSGLI